MNDAIDEDDDDDDDINTSFSQPSTIIIITCHCIRRYIGMYSTIL